MFKISLQLKSIEKPSGAGYVTRYESDSIPVVENELIAVQFAHEEELEALREVQRVVNDRIERIIEAANLKLNTWGHEKRSRLIHAINDSTPNSVGAGEVMDKYLASSWFQQTKNYPDEQILTRIEREFLQPLPEAAPVRHGALITTGDDGKVKPVDIATL